MHHNFTALPPDKGRSATLPRLHPYPNCPRLRSCISGDCSTSLVHAEPERSDLELRLRIRWHGQHAFLAHDHSTPFQDQITKVMSHPCKISTRAQVWSRCRQKTSLLCSGHRCQYKRRFRKAKRFERNLCEKPKLTISVPHRSFSKSSLHFRCFRAVAKAARFCSLFLIQSQND